MNNCTSPRGKKGDSPKSKGYSKKESCQGYGTIQAIEVGQIWKTREELSLSGAHRPKFASLHTGQEGVYSILINSKYRGKDNGLNVIYSGPKVKRKGRNGIYLDSLIKNYKHKKPIRIIRGARRNSNFAPSSGFRYDGLYEVEKYWKERDHMTFCLRRVVQQSMPPWIKTVPANPLEDTSKEIHDSDFSPFISFIRCQPNSPPANPVKMEQSYIDQTIPTIEIKDSDDDLTEEATMDIYEIQQDEDPPNDPIEPTPVPLPQEFLEHEQNDIFVIPEMCPPTDFPPDEVEVQPRFIGGMPVPKIIDVFKEEVTCSGLVVIETLPQQDVYEVYDESLVYEEAQADFTEVETPWKEEEIETKVTHDADIMQINNSIISHMQKLGISSDIDVEDGPKFANFLGTRGSENRSPTTSSFLNNHSVPSTNKKEVALTQDIVKVDHYEEEQLEETLPAQELIKHQLDVLPEQDETTNCEIVDQVLENSGNCLYIYPGTKCESVDQAEKVILSGNYRWYQGNKPIEEPSRGFTLHEVQEMLVPGCQPQVSKQSEHGEEEVLEQQESTTFPTFGSQELCIPGGTKTDKSQELEENVKHHHPVDKNCPYKDITLAELLSFTFNESQEGCICRWTERFPCMNFCIQEILRERKKSLNSFPERKQLMANPLHQIPEEKVGKINIVGSVDSSGNYANSTEHSVEVQLQDPFERTVNSTTDIVNNQENNSLLPMVQQLPQESNTQPVFNNHLVNLKHVEVLWRGLEEIRDEAMKRVYSMPQPMLDSLKPGDKELPTDVTKSADTEEKTPKIPWHFSERKEMFLQHHLRKQSLNTITHDSNVLSSPSLESSQPTNKVRMVQVRNIRTRINRTRIVQVNNSQLSTTSSTDRDISCDSLENIENVQDEDNVEQPADNNECLSNNWSNLHVITEEENTPTTSNSERVSVAECEDFPQDLQLQKESFTISNPSSPVSLNEDEKIQPESKKGVITETCIVPFNVEDKLAITSDQPLEIASPLEESVTKKSKVSKPPAIVLISEQDDLQTISSKEKLPSPDSDTTSFGRTCDELCKALPKTESDVHSIAVPNSAATFPVTQSGEGKEKRKRGRPRLRPRNALAHITEVTSSTEDSAVISLSAYARRKRINVSRYLKGFTAEEISKTKRVRKIFEEVMLSYKNNSCLENSTSISGPNNIQTKTKKIVKKN